MKLRFLPEALDDVREAIDSYEEQLTGLGREFAVEIGQLLRTIKSNPQAYSPDQKGTRRAHTRRFLHTVIYLIEVGEIWIVAAAHSSRDSSRWRDRL